MPVLDASLLSKPVAAGSKVKRILRLLLFAWICLLFFLYLAASPLVARNIYYKLLFRNVPYPYGPYDKKTVAGIHASDLTIASSDGVLLHGWYFKVPESKYVFLMHHGNGGNLSILGWYEEIAMRAGASVLVYDYRGYGKSTGAPSMNGICQDAQSAYDYLTRDLHWQPQQLINFGFSLGTGPASVLSSKKPCAGTILLSPYTSLQSACADALPLLKIYPSWLWAEPDIGSLNYVTKPHPPILVMHGAEDQLIPISHSKELQAKACLPLAFVTLPCGHGDLDRAHDLIQKSINAFVINLDSAQKPSRPHT